MTRTGRVPRLMAHEPMPSLQMHPDDAAALRLSSGDLARVATRHGAAVLPVGISAAMRPGEIFAAMHWTGAYGSADAIGQLVGAACDPVSGQPELKITAAAVMRLPVTWRALARGRASLPPSSASCFWSRAPVEGGELYRVAGWGDPPSGAALHSWARSFLSAAAASELIELDDPARGAYRLALLRDGQLESCLFVAIGKDAALPAPESLTSLFNGADWNGGRAAILAAGRSIAAADRMVCVCGNVTEAALRTAIIRDRLCDVGSLGEELGAGRICGSCIPELKEILRDAACQAA
jgi:assimilatory nitrate reductase catalytic subunit